MSIDSTADFYFDEEGNVVFTAEFLKKRGFCCNNGCRNCPYKDEKTEQKLE